MYVCVTFPAVVIKSPSMLFFLPATLSNCQSNLLLVRLCARRKKRKNRVRGEFFFFQRSLIPTIELKQLQLKLRRSLDM